MINPSDFEAMTLAVSQSPDMRPDQRHRCRMWLEIQARRHAENRWRFCPADQLQQGTTWTMGLVGEEKIYTPPLATARALWIPYIAILAGGAPMDATNFVAPDCEHPGKALRNRLNNQAWPWLQKEHGLLYQALNKGLRIYNTGEFLFDYGAVPGNITIDVTGALPSNTP